MNAKYVLHAENTCNIFNVHVIISLEVDLLPWTQHRPEKHGYSDLLVEITCTALLVHMIGLTNDVPWPRFPSEPYIFVWALSQTSFLAMRSAWERILKRKQFSENWLVPTVENLCQNGFWEPSYGVLISLLRLVWNSIKTDILPC